MGRKALVDRPVATKIWIPSSLRFAIESHLFSDADGRPPYGELSRFFVEAAKDRLKAIQSHQKEEKQE